MKSPETLGNELRLQGKSMYSFVPAGDDQFELDFAHLWDGHINPKHITFKGIKPTQNMREDFLLLLQYKMLGMR